jgi:hypothetical protein
VVVVIVIIIVVVVVVVVVVVMVVAGISLVIQISTKKSVIGMGIQLHNRVPINTKKLEEYKPYKRELKYFLILHVFYSVQEF